MIFACNLLLEKLLNIFGDHKKLIFKEELKLLEKHNIEYNEKYLRLSSFLSILFFLRCPTRHFRFKYLLPHVPHKLHGGCLIHVMGVKSAVLPRSTGGFPPDHPLSQAVDSLVRSQVADLFATAPVDPVVTKLILPVL